MKSNVLPSETKTCPACAWILVEFQVELSMVWGSLTRTTNSQTKKTRFGTFTKADAEDAANDRIWYRRKPGNELSQQSSEQYDTACHLNDHSAADLATNRQ